MCQIFRSARTTTGKPLRLSSLDRGARYVHAYSWIITRSSSSNACMTFGGDCCSGVSCHTLAVQAYLPTHDRGHWLQRQIGVTISMTVEMSSHLPLSPGIAI